jgi:parallel beta-helix repeat protein
MGTGAGIGRSLGLLTLVAIALGSLGAGQCSKVIVVRNGQSIQDAVDAALPGDTIVVRAGTYTAAPGADAVVEIMKDGITLIGNPNATIDATGVDYGIRVGTRSGGCLLGVVQGFHLNGFTIQNAENSGVLVANVDHYSMVGGRYLDNAEYGPYPVCSTDGLVAHNFASGHDDAAIYIGQSVGGTVEFNRVEDSTIGIEVENSSDIVVRKNQTRGNTAGIFVVVLPGLNFPYSDNVLVEDNIVQDNNRPNPSTGGDLALLPVGSGILNIGGDNLVIRRNVVERNDSLGIASSGNPFFVLDPRIEPFADGLEVRDNVAHDNGTAPDTDRALTPGADIVYSADVLFPPTIPLPTIPDPDPYDNCFDGNVYDTEYVEAAAAPGATLADFPCP